MSDVHTTTPETLAKSDQNLVWIDCEMTGLDPEKERLLEIAVIVTGPHLTPRIEGPVLVIHQSDELLGKMDAWNKGTHGKSGLIDKVKASVLSDAQVEAQMADNDYALGRVVERVARGKAAGSTLIFVIEDDAQNGADHVDARRSIAYVVGPYVRHGAVVSTRYTTVSLLRTIEAVLGLKPLGLNDALALPMADLFDPAQTSWSYRASAAEALRATQLPIPPERFAPVVATACRARSAEYWSAAMRGQDFSTEDKLDTAAFNTALWNGLGTGPEPVQRGGADLSKDRAALLAGAKPAC